MATRNCPDCDVALEETQYDANQRGNKIRLNDRGGGVLSKLGVTGSSYAYAYVCPECGLVRFYAE